MSAVREVGEGAIAGAASVRLDSIGGRLWACPRVDGPQNCALTTSAHLDGGIVKRLERRHTLIDRLPPRARNPSELPRSAHLSIGVKLCN